jgi:2-keto-3-deoxy-6-phosphogluconate aldolase
MDVDVEIDLLDAGLLRLVPGAFTPRIVAKLRVLGLARVETFPVAAWRQAELLSPPN